LSTSSIACRDRRVFVAAALLGLLSIVAVAMLAPPADATRGAPKVSVMTRNVYLGADLTPGIDAQSFSELVDAAGGILNEVDANKFQVRAKGLAKEILDRKPALVGLQEAALWRDAPCGSPFIPPQATHVHEGGDFIRLLMDQLNDGRKRYRLVVKQHEFDFESPANTDGSPDHSCDINARLTMRDAILARRHAGVKTSNPQGANFETLLQVRVSGVPVNVTRGWTAVDASVGDGPEFRFVNTHLEAFDNQPTGNTTNQGTEVDNGQVRKAQALELIQSGGPATGSKPVILLGDLNSDVKTAIRPGDGAANWALLKAGFAERSTRDPLSCCLETSLMKFPEGGGRKSQFDHKVDHIMTGNPGEIGRVRQAVTGRKPRNGFWNADHAGLFSVLKFR
jgi:endonuclease/exonuclease/phosphatase family metal-dependent hydrolase